MPELVQLLAEVRDGRRESVRGSLPKHIDYYAQRMLEVPPKKILSMIALPRSVRRARSPLDWTQIIAIAKFRTPFTIIDELSNALASAVSEMGIVPTIIPLSEQSLLTMSWQTPVIRTITTHGFLMFDQSENI